MKKIIEILSSKMTPPVSYGWFHFLWIAFIIICILFMFNKKCKYSDKKLNRILKIYGYVALILEIIKQIIWAYDVESGVWSYSWYSAPFQLCTTPIFASLIASYTKNSKFKYSLLSYIAYITILGSIATVIYPESCFCKTIEVNIHTMFLHCGSLVVSIYLLKNVVKIDFKSLIKAFLCFLIFEAIALLLDIIIYNSGILNGETFNMFYISPYFISSLPLFDTIQENLPYYIFLLIYNAIIFAGGFIVYGVSYLIKNKKKFKIF